MDTNKQTDTQTDKPNLYIDILKGSNLPALVNKIMKGQFAPVRGPYSPLFKQVSCISFNKKIDILKLFTNKRQLSVNILVNRKNCVKMKKKKFQKRCSLEKRSMKEKLTLKVVRELTILVRQKKIQLLKSWGFEHF